MIINDEYDLRVDSRKEYDLTNRVRLWGLAALGRPLIIDGEMAVPDKNGLTHLDFLQEARPAGSGRDRRLSRS